MTTLYRFFGIGDRLLYIGIAGNPGRRFNEHAGDKPWWPLVERSTMEHHPTREAALRAEAEAIRAERPAYNAVHNRARRMDPAEVEAAALEADRDGTTWAAPIARTYEALSSYHDLAAAIDNATELLEVDGQEEAAQTVAHLARIVPYGDHCERCHGGDPMRFPVATRVGSTGILATYHCHRCGFRWHCGWAFRAPWTGTR